MEFVIRRDEFLECLSTVTTITSSKEISSIVGNVLLEAEDNYISITATDLEKSLRNRVPALVSKKGSILLPGKKLTELVKGFRYDTMKFMSVGEKVVVQNGNPEQERKYKTHIEIMGMPSDEFPIPFQVNKLEFHSMSSVMVQEMINKVFYASAVDDARIVFNGIFVEFREDLLHFVATDGRRLALIKRKEENFLNGRTMIIPLKSVKEIKRLLADSEEIQIAHNPNENQVYIKSGDIYFSTKLIEGNFPDYTYVIPTDLPHRAEIYREDFINAIRQAMVFAPEPNKQVQLHFSPNILMVVSSTPELGKVEDGIECNYDGPNMAIGFNSNYLLDVLEALTSNHVVMSFKNPESPVLFHDPNDENFLCIVMPMKIHE
ncbi:MAG: DNA polymerase III subunit beta [Leptospiraceae bacterium]|nr:DNA polymerase III subunit beta [Leptospiraceae bacterium]MDW7976238.1 DNA polymerase III subunit beta [Leptospiraceae bacterium]